MGTRRRPALGQDLSERLVAVPRTDPAVLAGQVLPGFSPIGPALVTPDEFDDPDNIGIGCTLNGQQMQKGTPSPTFVFWTKKPRRKMLRSRLHSARSINPSIATRADSIAI